MKDSVNSSTLGRQRLEDARITITWRLRVSKSIRERMRASPPSLEVRGVSMADGTGSWGAVKVWSHQILYELSSPIKEATKLR